MSARPLLVRLALVLAALVPARSAAADGASGGADDSGAPPASAANDVDEGRRDFATGSERMRQGAYEEALAAFVASNRALPSPNTTLLIARCLRALGRLEEAAARFQEAAVDAEARVAAGEPRYQPAATSARAEGATLRANLGVLHLRLVHASGVTAVEVEQRRSPIRSDGTVDVLHRPGDVRYRLVEGDVVRASGRATVAAGRWTSVDVVVPEKSASASEGSSASAPEAVRRPAWLVPAAVTAGAVGLVGLGSFAFFGLRSQSTFDDLRDRCAPRCGASDRDAAARGDREQTIANVSLATVAVALGVGITLGVVALSRSAPPPEAAAWASPGLLRF